MEKGNYAAHKSSETKLVFNRYMRCTLVKNAASNVTHDFASERARKK